MLLEDERKRDKVNRGMLGFSFITIFESRCIILTLKRVFRRTYNFDLCVSCGFSMLKKTVSEKKNKNNQVPFLKTHNKLHKEPDWNLHRTQAQLVKLTHGIIFFHKIKVSKQLNRL